ncbi:DNA-binding HxlR family transcriptional regulator [Saccharothrix ecbatanensis]|uniref:DNA-binding HxlR family transcriptional regulator n=1 Tax=Saccharothrix ecbatanensis TaxID=1105145 RepID=A0A7W9LZ71_9PSEU|nr:winged helix-turn-helix transcriptional regulator [Saccharothrix ecbatanensis]MBB5801629.1 DNA-binding HxlR family transcriptional regulator [Saccharothrix ecbatanensis]
MATARSYDQACSAAHALDLVGERWALLVVRELLLGPKRFTDLRVGLPQAGPNVLSQRLRELERTGVVRRRKLPPPAASQVYELTDWGRELEQVLIQLTQWGSRSPLRDLTAAVGVDALMLALRSGHDPDSGLDASYTLRLGEDAFSIRVAAGHLTIVRGEAAAPDAVIDTDPRTFAGLMVHRQRPGDAIAAGTLTVTGDADAVERLLDSITTPEPAPVPET